MALRLCGTVTQNHDEYNLIFGIRGDNLIFGIRGDDTQLVASTDHAVLAAKVGYDLLWAYANKQKSEINWKHVEFLCLQTTDRGRRSPSHSIPGMTHGHRWKTAPWREEWGMASLIAHITTFSRRSLCGHETANFRDRVFRHLKQKASTAHNSLAIPQSLSGLGLGVWSNSKSKPLG